MVQLSVPRMTCGGCARSIVKAIQSVDPTAEVKTDVPNRRVVVQTSADAQALARVIGEAGYEAQPI